MTMAYKETETETVTEITYPYSVAVRFKDAAKPYSFGTFRADIHKGDWVVVETAQGLEMGEVEADALSVERYGLHAPTKPIIRIATETDHYNHVANEDYEKEAFNICQEEIEELELQMNLLSAQYTLDRSKILFIYLAEQRVDFRELLKRLGTRLHCRIELRQIGERDKAKMVGGIGMCGMECCCRRFKNRFDVISINMAKNQLLALNTEKLSGMCGKLMCCLKYEDNDYRELTEGLPKMGSQVEYEGKIYRITNMNVMNEEAKLENHEQVIFISLADLRDKAIPRKGVVMQKRNDGDKKEVIHRTASHAESDTTPHVSMELPSLAENRTRKDNGHRQSNRPNNPKRNHNAGGERTSHRDHKHTAKTENKPRTEAKNVTVRTFGRKKKEGENA